MGWTQTGLIRPTHNALAFGAALPVLRPEPADTLNPGELGEALESKRAGEKNAAVH